MKTRNSLVSNSSSSSFIIAYKESKCQCCGRSNSIIFDTIEKLCDAGKYNYEMIAKGKDQVHDRIVMDMYDYTDSGREENEQAKDLIKKIFELPDDMFVIYFDVSHHDDEILNEINAIEENKTGIILYRGEG